MNQEQAASVSSMLGLVAEDLLRQLEGKVFRDAEVSQFFLGTLARTKIMLRDGARILAENKNHELATAFILYRALLDDFMRTSAVFMADSPAQMVELMDAAALGQYHRGFGESTEINERYYQGKAQGLPTKEDFTEWKVGLQSDLRYSRYLQDVPNLRFKKMPESKELLRQGANEAYKTSVANAYVTYGRLSQHVHYSRFSYFASRDFGVHHSSVGELKHCFVYSYKMLLMHFSYFKKQVDLVWRYDEVATWFHAETTDKIPLTENGTG